MKTVLFQGDSITDCDRRLTFGSGYPLLVASELGYENPGEYHFVNKARSGSRIVDLHTRIYDELIHVQPDYMSLLIGVNDVWHELEWQNGIDSGKFETLYCMLIEEVKEALPDIKIFIMEPFCLRGYNTDNTEAVPNKWELFYKGVREKAEKAKAVAEKYGLPFVPLQEKFDELAKKEDASYWLFDGVHPTAYGHEFLKKEWIAAFQKLQKDEV